MLPHFTLDENEEEGLYSYTLIGKFDSKEELRQLYAESESLQAYARQLLLSFTYAKPHSRR